MNILRRIVSAALALALAALGLLLAVEAGNRLVGRNEAALFDYGPVFDELSSLPWSDVAARAGALLALLLGLFLLYAALRRDPQPLLMRSGGSVRCEIPRGEVERLLSLAADRVSGVRSSSAKVGRKTAKVTAKTRIRDPGDLPRDVETACQDRLDALMLEKPLQTKVRVQAGEK